MKKLVAISLFFVMTLHLAGYYFILMGMKKQNEADWQSHVIKDNFDDYHLLTKSIPITFPYQTDQKEFQTVDEKIELDGKIYRIVKKKYAEDTLHIVYLNDQKEEDIQKELDHLSDQMDQNEMEGSAKRTQNILLRMVISPYIYQDYVFAPIATDASNINHHSFYSTLYQRVFLSIPVPPPKSIFIS